MVTTDRDCRTAATFFPHAVLRCEADKPFSAAETRFLRDGPEVGWNKEAFVLQWRQVERCLGANFSRYSRVLRARADLAWCSFPAAFPEEAVLLPYRAVDYWVGVSDKAAAGPAHLLMAYAGMRAYILNSRNWGRIARAMRSAKNGKGPVEAIVEDYLFRAGVPLRRRLEMRCRSWALNRI